MKQKNTKKLLSVATLTLIPLLLFLLWLYIKPLKTQASTVYPNIILIVTDDQRWDSLNYMPTVQTELVAQGVTFSNAFASTPLCCPARASILTGQYAHTHGVIDNAGAVNLFNDSSTLATWLQDAGYRTALIGKYLNGYTTTNIPPGWDEWRVLARRVQHYYYDYQLSENGVLVSYGSDPANYSTDVLANKAADFVRSSTGTPFFLMFAPIAPHAPSIPAPRHEGTYSDLPPWRPPNFNEADVNDKPDWVRTRPSLNEGRIDADRIAQLESSLAVDDALAGLLDALDEIGQRDNTVIIFLSDQGLAWGEHRWDQKRCPYEECFRIPLVMVYPGLVAPGLVENRFVLNIDLAPTLLELAGVSIPASVEGTSLVPLLDGSVVNWRQDFLFEHWQGNSPVPGYAGLRNEEWKYVEYATGEFELYDLANDPYELINLADDPAYASILNMLRDRLHELQSSPTPQPTPSPTGTSQMTTPTPTPPQGSATPIPTRTPRPTRTATPTVGATDTPSPTTLPSPPPPTVFPPPTRTPRPTRTASLNAGSPGVL